jgi:hypothetical protein
MLKQLNGAMFFMTKRQCSGINLHGQLLEIKWKTSDEVSRSHKNCGSGCEVYGAELPLPFMSPQVHG